MSYSPAPNPRIAIIDFLTVVCPVKEMKTGYEERDSIEQIAVRFGNWLLSDFGLETQPVQKYGRNGYQYHHEVTIKGSPSDVVGFVAIGGNNDTACCTITGIGCSAIGYDAFLHIYNCLGLVSGHITRIDLAHDCFDGQVTIEDAIQWYHADLFTTDKAGAKPNAQLIDDFGSGKGKTFYVGSRPSGKMVRVYEKGKQLGDKNSKWVRIELELRRTKRKIPNEVLLKAADYLAGAYKCLKGLSAEQSVIATKNNTTAISYKHLEKYAAQSYGAFIDVMLELWESPEIVVEKLRRQGKIPRRLDASTLPVKE